MKIDALREMPDDEFERVVMQAVKRRADFPDWWRAVLHPDLIDDTEQVIKQAQSVAFTQSLEPGRYPHALGFAQKMQSVLAEVTLARITGAS